ncbi:MAG: hypothetical protein QXN34_06555 [Archaeoglobaceae archaeon]
MEYVTVSAKIPKSLKEKLTKYNIKPGPVIRKALEEEVKKRILEEIEEKAKKLSSALKEIEDEEIARLIREERER